jgi:hypothetical protein
MMKRVEWDAETRERVCVFQHGLIDWIQPVIIHAFFVPKSPTARLLANNIFPIQSPKCRISGRIDLNMS